MGFLVGDGVSWNQTGCWGHDTVHALNATGSQVKSISQRKTDTI